MSDAVTTTAETLSSAPLTLKRIIEDTDTRAGRLFALAIQMLIVVSVLSFSIETLPHLDPAARAVLAVLEAAIVLIFTAEYVLRLAVAGRKLRFIFSFYGLIDLAAILPFYLAPALDLRTLRVVRLLRLFRILKLARYNDALERLRLAFRQVREELLVFIAAAGLLLFLAAVGIYHFESAAQPEKFASVFHALWWAIATLTTVGYGDIYPITPGGRAFTALVMIIGIGVVAVPSGLMASALSAVKRESSHPDERPRPSTLPDREEPPDVQTPSP